MDASIICQSAKIGLAVVIILKTIPIDWVLSTCMEKSIDPLAPRVSLLMFDDGE
jgi:hypothetical protein